MDMSKISIEFNLQASIISSLYDKGLISFEVAEECIKRIKQRYLKLIKSLEEEENV